MTNLPTVRQLRQLLSYEPESGVLRWRVTRGSRAKVGGVAGSIDADTGYVRITINYRRFLAHRVAWAICHGKWPSAFMDHRDGNRKNNRINNLREANLSQNSRNCSSRRKSTSKYLGVSWHSGKKKWEARISDGTRSHHLGTFDDEFDAARAYNTTALKIHGQFARLNTIGDEQ